MLVVATDLMTGTLGGLAVAVLYAVYKEYRAAVIIVDGTPMAVEPSVSAGGGTVVYCMWR